MGVLRYIIDGEVRKPILALKLAAWAFFGVRNVCAGLFSSRETLAGLFIGLMRSLCTSRFSIFQSKNCISLELLIGLVIIFFLANKGLFLGYVGPFILCSVLAKRDFLGHLKGHSHAILVHFKNKKYVLTSVNAHK